MVVFPAMSGGAPAFERIGDRMVTIFGKDSCPYTQAAIHDCTGRGVPYEYVNVTRRHEDLARMLVHSGGKRRVPVIVDGDEVRIGFGGT